MQAVNRTNILFPGQLRPDAKAEPSPVFRAETPVTVFPE